MQRETRRSSILISFSVLCCFIHVCFILQYLSDSLKPYEPQPNRFYCPWDSPGKNTGVGCCVLLQGKFPSQGSNLHLLYLLHWQAGSYHQHHLGSPISLEAMTNVILVSILMYPFFILSICIHMFSILHKIGFPNPFPLKTNYQNPYIYQLTNE